MNGNVAADQHVNAVVHGHAASQAEYAHAGYQRHYVAHVSPAVRVLRVRLLLASCKELVIYLQFESYS